MLRASCVLAQLKSTPARPILTIMRSVQAGSIRAYQLQQRPQDWRSQSRSPSSDDRTIGDLVSVSEGRKGRRFSDIDHLSIEFLLKAHLSSRCRPRPPLHFPMDVMIPGALLFLIIYSCDMNKTISKLHEYPVKGTNRSFSGPHLVPMKNTKPILRYHC